MSQSGKSSGVRIVLVDSDRDGQRIDNFLTAHLKGVPRAAVYRMIRTGQVRINGGRCKAATRVERGDEVRIPPARLRDRGEFMIPERARGQISDSVLFENQDLMVIDKPPGMVVHSGSGLPWGLIDVIRQLRPEDYFELVHRLDRETSGCLVLARNGSSLNYLAAQFREGRVEKNYLCLMNGRMPEPLIEVDAPLGRVQNGEQRLVEVRRDGKAAFTRFRLLEQFRDCSYVSVELFTGRTHQIRAHAKHIGMPLAADERYSDSESFRKWKKRGLKRIFLHAHRVGLTAPSGESMEFSAPLPPQLQNVLDGMDP
jgi:23S rRNA pseudouridine955/2504/2580 synthase